MDWFKKHADTIIILATLFGSFTWMNGKFHDIDQRFAFLEREVSMIKMVLLVKDIMPGELATKEKNKGK